MGVKTDGIGEVVKDALSEYSLKGISPVKVLLLVLVCAFVAFFFFPAQTFYSFSYKSGDVAVADLRSPVDVEVGGVSIKKGEIVVREGERITEDLVLKLDRVEEAIEERGTRRGFISSAGLFIFTVVLITVAYLFSSVNIRKFRALPRDLAFMATIFLGVLLLLKLSGSASLVMHTVLPAIPSTVYVYMIPVAAGAMLVRLFLNSETALVFAAVISVMAGFFLGSSLEIAAYVFIGSIVAVMGVRHATQRATIMQAGFHLAIVNSVVLLSMAAIRGSATLSEPVLLVVGGCLNGVITAVIVVGIAPLLEMVFGYTTNIRLLELSRMDHPLLKELAVRAPGTYHHSIIIGSLVESAAVAISANPLLARVSAYYHDIGKMKMPLYFIENISGENRHDKLAPTMSALILTNHVKEGVELANSYKLGTSIVDVIEQHHGDSLIKFFYERAEALSDDPVDDKEFRYPGPKPQTKEAGLVMLADAIEAASRTLHDPTQAKIQGLTQNIINRIFTDGQLDECELTLKDLHLISSNFNRVLAGIYHNRVEYPEPAFIKKEDESEDTGPREGKGGNKKGKDTSGGRSSIKRLGVK